MQLLTMQNCRSWCHPTVYPAHPNNTGKTLALSMSSVHVLRWYPNHPRVLAAALLDSEKINPVLARTRTDLYLPCRSCYFWSAVLKEIERLEAVLIFGCHFLEIKNQLQ